MFLIMQIRKVVKKEKKKRYRIITKSRELNILRYGPYVQSERSELYKSHAHQLLKDGHAYHNNILIY